MEFTIRTANKADLPQLLELYRELQPHDPPINADKANNVWEQAELNGVKYFVADHDGRVAATCYIAIIPNITRQCASIGFIENIVTAAWYRHRGIGRKLLKTVIEYAKAQGCYKIALQSGTMRTEAHEFYKAVGFDGDSKRAFEIRF